jgi:hypothetical protein
MSLFLGKVENYIKELKVKFVKNVLVFILK